MGKAIVLVVLASLAVSCAEQPPPEAKLVTEAILDTDATRLARAVTRLRADHPGQVGIRPLTDPPAAFAARALLVDAAEKGIDAQYYMWHGDITGTMLFERLWRAAERGVRVRLHVDDNNTGGLDETLAALDSHQNLHVRLYNPLTHRRARALSYVLSPRRLNHRMHNKSLTVDHRVTVVGGRNVGDEYFGAGHGVVFTDLDVLAVGPVVDDVSAEFDQYWNSPSALPADQLLPPAGPDELRRLQGRFEAVRADPDARGYVRALHETALVKELLDNQLSLEWGDAQLVSDDPAKTLVRGEREDLLLLPRMLDLVGQPAESMDLVSPYFVPMESGTAVFQGLARRGTRVRVLTNSLAATDVAAVHAGYAQRRKALLEAGVQLFELKRAPDEAAVGEGGIGSSSASLHAKTFAVDGQKAFVGSFNFDPRSARLNTEMGLVIENPVLARGIHEWFDTRVPLIAYEVKRDADGALYWIERTDSGEKRFDTEPEAGYALRAWVGFLSILPIEREL